MAASFPAFLPLRNPNPSLYGTRASSSSSFLPLGPVRHSPLSMRGLGARLVSLDRRMTKIVPLAASRETTNHIEVETGKSDAKVKVGESQEAWKEALEHFKTEAMKVKALSQEAYQLYSNKAMEILVDASEKIKIQADKAQHDLSVIAKEISDEGKEYLSAAAKNSPDSVRDTWEIYSSTNELQNMSSVRDFYLGIPYGSFLSIGGFIYFMLTGSIPAIRFGVVLGTAIFALSVSSMRSRKNGKSALLLLIGQTAISAIIFFRQWLLCSQRGSFPNLLMLLISGAMVGFYVYRIVIDSHKRGPSVEQSSES